jgi:hypothetical protein
MALLFFRIFGAAVVDYTCSIYYAHMFKDMKIYIYYFERKGKKYKIHVSKLFLEA